MHNRTRQIKPQWRSVFFPFGAVLLLLVATAITVYHHYTSWTGWDSILDVGSMVMHIGFVGLWVCMARLVVLKRRMRKLCDKYGVAEQCR